MSNQEKHNASHTIEVKLTVPKITWLEKVMKKVIRFFRPKKVRIATAALFVISVSFAVTVSVLNNGNFIAANNAEQNPLVTEQDLTAKTPYYATVLPEGKTIEQLGGWTRVSPSDRNAVFAYDDTIDTNRIVVSQQPLPEDFKQDTETQVEALAKGYKATERITVNGMTVHIARSAKGPESIILAKNGLLILIRSSVEISNDQWIGYINSLHLQEL